jgi:maltose O-acetyltransferase
MIEASVAFARRARRRALAELSRAPSRVLVVSARTVLRLRGNPNRCGTWEVAKTERLLAGLSAHGKNIIIQHPVTIEGPEAVTIGNDVSIAAYVHLWGTGGVTVGDRVMIGTHTSISSLTHDYTQKMMHRTRVMLPVEIGDDVWIGSNCVVMPGVHLGTGCVVGAGSVVTKDVPPLSIVAGVPARVVGVRPLNVDLPDDG